MKKIYLAFLFLTFSVVAQSTKDIYTQSTKSYQDNDFNTFLKLTKKLDSIRPSHPTFTYNLVCGFALNNLYDDAFSVLEKCILNNSAIAFETEKDLQVLKQFPKYISLVNLKSKLNEEVKTSSKVLALTEKDLHPEGLVFLKKSNLWLAGSIHKRKVVSFDSKTGTTNDWLKDKSMLAVLALKSDNKEKTIWIVTSAIPEMENFSKDAEGKSEVLQVEIKSKKILQRIPLNGNHVLGDILVTKSGEIFISDSSEPIIHKVVKDKIVTWINLKNEAFNLQGITIDNQEKSIFIADYLKGILKINIENPSERKWLAFPSDFAFKGIDGLQFYKNSLIAIQNGVKPIRITQHFLNKEYEIQNSKILDHNRPEFNEPTLGVLFENKFFFFANSPWSSYDKFGNLKLDEIEYPLLFSTKLN